MLARPITHTIADFLVSAGLVKAPIAAPVEIPEPIRFHEAKQKIATRVVQQTQYDPDEDVAKLLQPSYKPFDMNFEKDVDGKPIAAVSAQLYEVSRDGLTYTVRKYVNRDELLEAIERARTRFAGQDDMDVEAPWRLREVQSPPRSRGRSLEVQAAEVLDHALHLLREGYSLDQVRHKLREDFASGSLGGGTGNSFRRDWDNFTYGDGRDADAEYAPIMGGPWSKQLYLHQYLDMHAKAFEAYNHNPWAHQVIELTTMFTLGRGIDHTCSNVEVDEVLREFCDRTEFYPRLETMMTDLWWAGENITEFYDNTPIKGQTDFRAVDPSTVWEIITDPEDIRKVYYAHQQYSTPYQLYVTGAPAATQPLAVKYIIRQIPAKQFMHWKINVSEWEKRGRSDIFCVLGWVKRLKDLLNARVIKGQLEAAFVWDITIASGDADVESIGLQLPDPYNPGATFVHNKSLELKPQASQIRGSEAAPDIMTLMSAVATGASTSVDFLGGSNTRSSSSSTLARTEPPTKRYERRQMLIQRYTYKMFDRVINNAQQAGLIDLDEVLQDARTVKRLSVTEDELPDMDDQRNEMEDKQTELDQQQQQVQKQQMSIAQQQADANTAATKATNGSTNGKISPTPLVNVNRSKVQETLVKTVTKTKPLNDEQKRRIKAIKASGQYARELIELSFPAIAQEERSAKLKDLALAEAMEWLPKSIVATMAAKELNISTYDFQETWATIVEEAKKGMSIAHVFGQDNKHVPEVAIAQGVQEEMQAEQPVGSQPMLNIPVPPAVNEMKQEPNKGGPGNGPPPGQKPNSGDSKTNQQNSVTQPRASGPSHGYSAAANSPMTSEGRSNIKARENDVIKRAIYTVLLKEAIAPLTTLQTGLARYILERGDAVKELEESVDETEKMRIRDDNDT